MKKSNLHASWCRLRLSGVYVDATLAYTDLVVGALTLGFYSPIAT